MKKAKFVILTILLLLLLTSNVSAAKIGDIIGKACYTDIIASINDYNIPSYNIDGKTFIIAEDLRNYGFNVGWLENERALYITRGSQTSITSTYIAPEVSQSQIGKTAYSVLHTDIKTYVNNQVAESYNIGGNTVVYFEDLSVFGEVNWSQVRRRLDLSIYDLPEKIGAPISSILCEDGIGFKKNSVDGIQIYWQGQNNTNKTINYYTTYYFMYNSVGDFAYDEITGEPIFVCKTVGPVHPGNNLIDFTGEYDTEAYSGACSKILLYSIELEYSDGTSEEVYYDKVGYKTLR